jgi:phospholipid/cholesterol/gamma-HCH transport system permease protein
VIRAVGAAAVRILEAVGEAAVTLGRVLRAGRHIAWPEAWRQAYQMANQSLPFVSVTLGFLGAVLVTQAAGQAQRIVGDLSAIGPTFLQLLVSEFGPVLVGFMVAARYGAGVAAEVAAMQITEQVDALHMAGVDLTTYLVAPRVWGGLMGSLPITAFGTAVAFGSGAFVGSTAFGMGLDAYFDTRLTLPADVAVGVLKAMAFGITVPLVATCAGLRAQGGAPGVGRATTEAVIGASVALLALDLLIGLGGYVLGFTA